MMIVATGMRAAALPQRVNAVSPVARLSHVIPLQFVPPLQQLLVTPPLTQVVVIPLTQPRTLTHHAAPLIMPVMQRWITVVAHPVAAHAPAHLRPRRAAVATTGLRSSKRTPTQLI